jgi:hypothetical protein
MATLTVCEYQTLPNLGGIIPQVAQEPCVTTKTYAIGSSTAQSAAFSAGTQYVRVDTDAICRVEFGANPTALVGNSGANTGSKRMQAGAVEYFAVTPGHKIAVIADV